MLQECPKKFDVPAYLFLLKNFPLQMQRITIHCTVPAPKNNSVRVTTESLMRKFALIAIRKPTLLRIFVNLNDRWRTVRTNSRVFYSLLVHVRISRTSIRCVEYRQLGIMSATGGRWKGCRLLVRFLFLALVQCRRHEFALKTHLTCTIRGNFRYPSMYQYLTKKQATTCNKQFLPFGEIFESATSIV